MATVESIYVDPSALVKLYLREPESRAMSAWRSAIHGPLLVTLHGRVEVVNALGLAAHRGVMTPTAREHALAAFAEDFDQGRYVQADLLWRATLERAADLSRRYTLELGCRSLDVLHVASALELRCSHFVTFDARQRRLAAAVDLKLSFP